MSRIIGGIAASHAPTIGFAYDRNKRDDPVWAPIFQNFADVIPADNILFASEMIAAVRGIDPQTGHHYDDTKRYIDAADVDAGQRRKIYETNPRRVYPRLDAALKGHGP